VQSSSQRRIAIPHDPELNRVLGGGIVPGSILLIGGQPGIGKSTLVLQLANRLKYKVLYVSGEESAHQVKMRADRLGGAGEQCYIYCETQMQAILKQAKEMHPDILIIDSIQTLHTQELDSTAGSVSQIRECTAMLQEFAKTTDTPVLIIGHITKDGSLAGPKLLEHMVDCVLQFEGDQHYVYRILRTIKNRFGSTDELGIYEMEVGGLRPVTNPSELLLSQSNEQLSGSAIASTIEGIRPLLIESQALVTTSVYGTPQRSATGFDIRRLSMLLAVLEKKCGLFFGQQDVFLNIAGGIKVTDPAIDLSIVAALISSLQDIPVGRKVCFAGEVGLSGEVRAVNRMDQRILEADRLGFEQIFVSKYHKKSIPKNNQIEVKTVGKVSEMVEMIFS
jgi:DNA repair protein RadA/Sms